jgi:hypothetical protein
MELVGRLVGWFVRWLVSKWAQCVPIVQTHAAAFAYPRVTLYVLTRLRVKKRVRIFHRKKETQDTWHHIKGVLFAGQCPVSTVIHRSVLEKTTDFLSSCTSNSFSRKRPLYGVYLAKVVKNSENQRK